MKLKKTMLHNFFACLDLQLIIFAMVFSGHKKIVLEGWVYMKCMFIVVALFVLVLVLHNNYFQIFAEVMDQSNLMVVA